MKNKAFICIATAFSALAFAQQNPNLELKIKDYSAKIDSIVISEKSKMNKELDDFEAKSAQLSDFEKKQKRTEIATKYENSINEKVNSEKDRLEEITQQSVKDAVAGKNSANKKGIEVLAISHRSLIEINSGKKSPKDLLKNDGLVVNVGFQSLNSNSSSLNFHNDSKIRTTFSSASILYQAERQIGKYTSPFFVRYGIGWTGNDYALEKPLVFAQGNGQLFTTEFTDGNLKRTKINLNYLEIPVDFQWVINPTFIEENGEKYLDMKKKQFRIGLGLYGQYKIGSRIHIDYSNDESSKNIFRQRVENGVSRAVLGAKFNIGYGSLNFFIKKDLTPAFTGDAKINDKYGLSVGITLANLNL